jgi:putative transposase
MLKFMSGHQREFAVERICMILDVSRSGYYGWLSGKPSKSNLKNDVKNN